MKTLTTSELENVAGGWAWLNRPQPTNPSQETNQTQGQLSTLALGGEEGQNHSGLVEYPDGSLRPVGSPWGGY